MKFDQIVKAATAAIKMLLNKTPPIRIPIYHDDHVTWFIEAVRNDEDMLVDRTPKVLPPAKRRRR